MTSLCFPLLESLCANMYQSIVVGLYSPLPPTPQWFPYILHVCAWSCPILWDPTLYTVRLPWPWNFPGKKTGVGCHFLLQGIFLTQGSNSHLFESPALADGFCTTNATWKASFLLSQYSYANFLMSSLAFVGESKRTTLRWSEATDLERLLCNICM